MRNDKRTRQLSITEIRYSVLSYILSNKERFHNSSISKACLELNIAEHIKIIAFPRGGIDLALWFHACTDSYVRHILHNKICQDESINSRIHSAIMLWINRANIHKGSTHRCMSILSSPIYIYEGITALKRTSTSIINATRGNNDSIRLNDNVTSDTISITILLANFFAINDTSEHYSRTEKFVEYLLKYSSQMRNMTKRIDFFMPGHPFIKLIRSMIYNMHEVYSINEEYNHIHDKLLTKHNEFSILWQNE